MTVFTEGPRTAEFLAGDPYGADRREVVTIASGQNLAAGTVLGLVTASSKYVLHDPAASDGSQNAAAIVYADVNATGADRKAVAITRDAIVNANLLTFKAGITGPQKTAAFTALALKGITKVD